MSKGLHNGKHSLPGAYQGMRWVISKAGLLMVGAALSICQLVVVRNVYCILLGIVLGAYVLSSKATSVCIVVTVRILLFGWIECNVWLHRIACAVAPVPVAVVHGVRKAVPA